jgi:hypothetical protein
MYTGSIHLHSLLRWVVLALMLVMLYRSFMGRSSDRTFKNEDRKVALFLLIGAHLQLLIGLYQYFVGPWGIHQLDNLSMGEVMKNAMSRFYLVEHALGMIIGITLITIAYSTGKKALEPQKKWNRMFILYAIAFVIIMVSIPWPFRMVGEGRAWFPGM